MNGHSLAFSLTKRSTLALAMLVCFSGVEYVRCAEPSFKIWPQEAPNEKGNIGAEQDMTKPDEAKVDGKPVIRLGNVSEPTLTLYKATGARGKSPCVLVCPGGGYYILALDLEGTEVCEWLNSIGVSAALLKYRVPRREGREAHEAPLEDAQRAMSILRSRAEEFSIDPNKIGVLGFSAGGHLSAMLSASGDDRTYKAVDDADKTSCKPNFTLLIYPGYLVGREDNTKLSPGLKVTAAFPPTFMVMTQDDPVDPANVLVFAGELTKVKVPVVAHLYSTGGHGYGLRKSKESVTKWPELAADWLRSIGVVTGE